MTTVIVASDAPSVRSEVTAAIAGPDLGVIEASSGPEVVELVDTLEEAPSLLIVDLQMGNMGGMATSLELSLEESYLDVPHVPILMLLDRRPDVYLAKQSGVEGWLIKPLDPLRLRRAVATLVAGGTFADDSYAPTPLLVPASPRAAESLPPL